MAARARLDRRPTGAPAGRAAGARGRVDGRPRDRVTGAVAVVLAVVAGMVLAACAGPPEVTNQPDAHVAIQADCLDARVVRDLGLVPDEGGSAEPAGSGAVTPGGVPEDFAPVSVLVCSASGTLRSASGTWVAVTESRREGDLAPLLAALERPSQEPTGACEATAAVPTVLWLVDVLGRAVRPVWPTDRCGAPVADVHEALDALVETDTTDFPVERIVPSGPPSGR
jgi:hypothetical protein